MYVHVYVSRGRDYQTALREAVYDQDRHLLSNDVQRDSNLAIGPGSADPQVGLFDPLAGTFLPAYGPVAADGPLTAASGGFGFDFSRLSAGADIVGGDWGDYLFGGSGDDVVSGGQGRDLLRGGLGDDRLDGGSGNDRLYGGAGDDTYVVDSALDYAFEAAGCGQDTVTSSVSFTLRTGSEIETLQLAASTGLQNLNLTGNEFSNTLVGNDGANRIDGRGGVDHMLGGKGDDVYFVDDWVDRVIEDAGGGFDTVYASADHCLLDGQEVEVLRANAGSRGIHIMGNELAQTIIGGAGDDVIHGDGGADILRGQGGRDTFAFIARVDATPGADRPTIVDFKQGEDGIYLQKLQAIDGATGDRAFTWIGADAFSHRAGELHQVRLGASTLVEGDTDGDGAADIQILLKGIHTLQASDFTL